MAYEKKNVTELPQLDITAPLPELPEKTVLMVFGSPLRNAEKEWVIATVTTAAIRAGKWQPVDVKTFMSILQHVTPQPFWQGAINALWGMADEGLMDIVRLNDETDYVVPSAQLADMVASSSLRYAEEGEDQLAVS